MSYRLTDFLISLASDGIEVYSRNPEEYMESCGLSHLQKEAVRSGSPYRIRRLAAEEMLETVHGQVLTNAFKVLDPHFKGGLKNLQNSQRRGALNDADEKSGNSTVPDSLIRPNMSGFQLRFGAENPGENQLVVTGSGITGANHLTRETESIIGAAGKVLYCVADFAIERRIMQLNSKCEDLYKFYGEEKPRRQTYNEMVERILQVLQETRFLCVVFYGHPGILTWAAYEAIRKARLQGFRAHMLPAISSLDCLIAEIGFDRYGYALQIFEATDMLIRNRNIDPNSAVAIFQVGCVASSDYSIDGARNNKINLLSQYLLRFYISDQEVILFEATQYPVCPARVELIRLDELATSTLSNNTTLFIAPKKIPEIDQKTATLLGTFWESVK